MKKRVVLGVTASIAAYKAAEIVSALKKQEIDVHVIMTKHSTHFITPLTMQILSENPVHVDVMTEPSVERINHIYLAQNSDLFVIAPATANIIGKIANGLADDMLSTVSMAVPNETPKLIAPAMNTKMYENKSMQHNLQQIKEWGFKEITPVSKVLACGDIGIGGLAQVNQIVAAILDELGQTSI